MSELMHTSQIHNRLAQKIVLHRSAGERFSLHHNLRHDINNRAGFPIHLNALCFAVEPFVRGNPSKANEGALHCFSFAKFQLAPTLARPGIECQFGQFAIRVAIARHAFTVIDEICDGFTIIEPA